MNLLSLVSRPWAFFEARADSLGWAGSLAGFYLFGFAMYFQNYLVPGYHVPFYFVIYVAAWFPTLMVAIGLFVALVLFWCWPASMVLANESGFERCTKIVGMSLLPPAVLFCAVLLILAVLNSNDVAVPYRAVVLGAHSVAGLWAFALVTVGAAASNKFTARKSALFVLWLIALIVLLVLIVYAMTDDARAIARLRDWKEIITTPEVAVISWVRGKWREPAGSIDLVAQSSPS